MEDRSWSDLPSELLELILSWLPVQNHPSFHLVCKSWSDVRVYLVDDIGPLLAYFKRWGDGILHHYSPILNKSFKLPCPLDLSKCELYSSKDGWLVLYREREVILANPFANVMHNFPGLPFLFCFSGIAFSGCPPNNDFMIFAIESELSDYVSISIWDSQGWDPDIRIYNNRPFLAAPYSSPVVYDGSFYCLGLEGNLGVFNPKDDTWTVLADPKSFPYKPEDAYLVESKGKLLAVLVGNQYPPVQVMSLNKATMVWEKIFALSSQTLFAGPGVSFVTTKLWKRMEDKVFLSRLLAVPETIEVQVRDFGGRPFLIPEPSSPGEGIKERVNNKGGVCTYRLKACKSSKYCGSIAYPSCVWYEPRLVKKSNL